MSIPIFFIWFLIAIFIFRHHLRKNSKINEDASKKFWAKEQSSLVVRKRPLSENDYVKPSLDITIFKNEAYFTDIARPDLLRLQSFLSELISKNMVNFSHLTNADVRLQFGTALLTSIELYEINYTNYIQTLYKLGKEFYDIGETTLAKSYLEEGLTVKTDIRPHVLLLATIYKDNHDTMKIDELIEYAKTLNILTKDAMIGELESLKN